MESSSSKDKNIKVVRLACKGELRNRDRQFIETLDKPHNDPIFEMKPNCPIGRMIGLPLCIYKLDYDGTGRGDYVNQWATFCMIDADDGFAPMSWQDYVGPVQIFRPGGVLDFTKEDMIIFNDFLNRLLNSYGSEEGVNPKEDITARKFVDYAIGSIKSWDRDQDNSQGEEVALRKENVTTIDLIKKCIRS